MKLKNYDFIDCSKFFMALLVVSIHITIIPECYNFSTFFRNSIARIAVPFFFITSGFFFFNRIQSYQWNQLLKPTKRILTIFISWTFIYALIHLFLRWHKGESDHFIFSVKFLFRHLILNPWGHLWFLPALLIGIIMTWTFLKLDLKKTGLIIAFCLYCIGIFGDSYYHLITKIDFLDDVFSLYHQFSISTKNGVFFGFPIVYLSTIKLNLTKKTNLSLSILFFILLLLEYHFLEDNKYTMDHNMYFSLLFFTLFFFNFATQVKVKIPQNTTLFFRAYALGIYLIHPMWITIGVTRSYLLAILLSISLIWIIKKYKIPLLNHILK